MNRRNLAGVSFLVVMLIVAAACGQKPGVDRKVEGLVIGGGGAGVTLPEGTTVDEEGNILDAEGNVIGNVDEGITDSEVLAELSGGGGPAATGATGDGTGGDTGDTGAPGDEGDGGDGDTPSNPTTEPGGGTTTGVTKDVIKIGIHAPLSGAAPVPSDSVDRGKDLYFKWLEENGKSIFGRRVEVVLKNDQYNPSTAVSVCQEMVERDKVFMLSGAAGTDQIAACARYAESVGVPYISAGVTEIQLDTFDTYFATSMTYPDQGPLLVDYMKNKLGAAGEKNGMLFFDTQSFSDAHQAFKAAAQRAGVRIVYDRLVSKNAGTSEARSAVQEMKLADLDNVFVLTSPVFFINVLKQANTQAFKPQWVGVGITMTFDTVLAAACPDGDSANGAKFFSPFPAWADRNRFDPDFERAVRQFHPSKCGSAGCGDDFMLLSWQAGKTYAQLLSLPGKNLTRERFIYFAERARNLRNGLGPTLNFSPTDHFGANQVHVSQASCGDRRWHTIQSFASDF